MSKIFSVPRYSLPCANGMSICSQPKLHKPAESRLSQKSKLVCQINNKFPSNL